MKERIVSVLLILVAIAMIGAGGIIRIRDVQGDKAGDPSLRQNLINKNDSITNRWTKAQADARFNKISDNANAYNYFYSKNQSDSLSSLPHFAYDLRKYGIPIVGAPDFAYSFGYTSLAMTPPRLYPARFTLTDTLTVNSIMYDVEVKAVNIAHNTNYTGFAIYSYDGTTHTATLLAYTPSDSTIITKPIGIHYKSFSSTITLLPGTYYVCVNLNFTSYTTRPSFGFCGKTVAFAVGDTGLLNGWIASSGATPVASFDAATLNSNSNYIPTLLLLK